MQRSASPRETINTAAVDSLDSLKVFDPEWPIKVISRRPILVSDHDLYWASRTKVS